MATRIEQQRALMRTLTRVVRYLEELGYEDDIRTVDSLILTIARRADAERNRNGDVVPFLRPPRGSKPKKR